jgi:hypothetical protein
MGMPRYPALVLWISLGVGLALAEPLPVGFADDLPERLSNEQFWALSGALSEPGDNFISDNLVSNEMSFAQVVPELNGLPSKGVYIGVGPEQNFTFLAAMDARMGFIIDIRRENLLLHLMYKAVFDLSPTRGSFLSRLFSRPNLAPVSGSAQASELMEAVAKAPVGSPSELQTNTEQLRNKLLDGFRLSLTPEELATIEKIYKAFHEYGPIISYSTTLLKKPVGLASYANLMKQTDSKGQELGFLASEARYEFVREMQRKNLIVPVVGNFAGKTALRAIGNYLRARSATVLAFYVSNVEDYLGRERVPQNGEWGVFCENVASLPIDDRSVFVRPLGLAAFDSERRLMLSPRMQISSREFDVYPAGSAPELKKALSKINPEVAQCRK